MPAHRDGFVSRSQSEEKCSAVPVASVQETPMQSSQHSVHHQLGADSSVRRPETSWVTSSRPKSGAAKEFGSAANSADDAAGSLGSESKNQPVPRKHTSSLVNEPVVKVGQNGFSHASLRDHLCADASSDFSGSVELPDAKPLADGRSHTATNSDRSSGIRQHANSGQYRRDISSSSPHFRGDAADSWDELHLHSSVTNHHGNILLAACSFSDTAWRQFVCAISPPFCLVWISVPDNKSAALC